MVERIVDERMLLISDKRCVLCEKIDIVCMY